MYSPSRWRSGRDSIRVRFTSRAANSDRQRTSQPGPADPALPCKTSLAFWGAGDASPGWLVRCLSEFAFRGVNLTKIESRPMRARLGHYRFFVDCEGDARQTPVAEAVAGLHAHCERVEVLGSYPAAG